MRKILFGSMLLPGLLLGLVLFLAFYQPHWMVTRVQRMFPHIIFHVPTQQPYFALTFDDGPNPPYTDQVLQILRDYDVHATFFLIGENVAKHPEYVDKIRQDGHHVANHLHADIRTWLLSLDEFRHSLQSTEALIRQTTQTLYFRPARIWIRPAQWRSAAALGYRIILGSVYVSDVFNPFESYMLWAMKRMLRPGCIVALHDGGGDRSRTVAILPGLLEYARTRGLQAVTVEMLMKANK